MEHGARIVSTYCLANYQCTLTSLTPLHMSQLAILDPVKVKVNVP